jgi:hypothetical protein
MSHFANSSGSVWGLINVNEHVREYVEQGDWDSLAKFTHEALTAVWINNFMVHTRKIWVPQIGRGSQNAEPLGYQVLSEAVLDVLEAERREYAGMMGDEFGDEEESADSALVEYFMPKGEAK